MSKKKHIDELFKGQLQNFEATPSPEVWNNIQAKMKKEEEDDRKVIPLWWKLGGVAAGLALLLALNFVFQPFSDTTEPILVTENPNTTIDAERETPALDESSFEKEAITSEAVKEASEDQLTEDPSLKNKAEKTLQDQITDESKNNRKAVTVEEKTGKSKFETKSELLKKTNSNDPILKKDAIGIATTAKTSNKKVTSEKTNGVTNKKDQNRNPLIKDTRSEVIESKVITAVATSKEKATDDTTTKKTGVTDRVIKKDVIDANTTIKDEAITAIGEKDDKEDAIDSEENKISIFEAIEEDKEDALATEEEKTGKNWEVTPNFGPVFYNSIDGGSAIDPSFADNAQSGDVNFSYGVQVSYAITDRLSVRSGVSNVDLGYTTGDVELATGPVSAALGSIDYGGRNVVLSAYDRGTLSNLPPQGEGDPFNGLVPKSTGGSAEIIQNLSYYEVPLELKYALLNKRFGVNMIGGFSTLFLGDNEISVQDGSFRDVLGAANNLNSVSFSTNVGLGLDYKISKRLKFNVEPMFKYQLNPYSDASVDFRPYYFGVYSGLSFKF